MALGHTTYKTPNAIFTIGEDLTGKEGCGVKLHDQGFVKVADATTDVPYGIVTVGGPPEDGGPGPGLIGGSSVEFVDMLGCTVQVQISVTAAVAVGEFLVIDSAEQDGTFTGTNTQPPSQDEWLWGLALTNAGAGEQCLMRFQPNYVWYIAPPPP